MATIARTGGSLRRMSARLWIMLSIALMLGVALRTYRFPQVPAGLNQDEISAAYESYSLLKTGADRWGNHLPLYFVSWGTGQSVLQSYLQIPVVAIFGLTALGTRLIPMLFGIATIPVFFFALWITEGAEAACAGSLMLAVAPWHVMLSRWGLECNLMPFFILLGILTFCNAIESGRARRIVPSLLPFALALYAYGMAVLIVPSLILLLLWVHRETILEHRVAWSSAVGSAFLLGSPIGFFALKNYVIKRNYDWERHLPFSIPLLPETRLSQVSFDNPLTHNLLFLLRGLQDRSPWNQVPHVLPLSWFMLLLAALGIFYVLRHAIKQGEVKNPFFLWLLASLPVLVKVPVNINQANTLFLSLLAMAALGFAKLPKQRTAAIAVLCLLCVASAALFSPRYFGRSYQKETDYSFNPSLPSALRRLDALRPRGVPVYVTESVLLNYVQTLFYLRINPKTYQLSGATYSHPDFGDYVFRTPVAVKGGKMTYLLRPEDPPLCINSTTREQVGSFLIGVCDIQP